MENVIAENLIHRALNEYDAVREELNRPSEDLVMIAVCGLVKKAIADFLAAFLFEKGILVSPNENLLEIQQKCVDLNPEFGEVELESIACLSEDTSMVYTHTLEGKRLQKYAQTLEKIRELVLSSLR